MTSCLPIGTKALNPQEPQQYHEKATIQQERALENLAGWNFYSYDRVLDVGCGPGKITASIAGQVPNGSVVGIDISSSMCEQARNQYTSNNLTFIQGDARSIPDEYEDSFDKVTCFAVLSWIPLEDHQQIFNQIAKSLKIGGKALSRMSAEGDRPLNQAAKKVIENFRWKEFFIDFILPAAYQNERRLQEIAEEANLNVVKIEDATTTRKFNTKDEFVEWLLTWEPHRLAIEESSRRQFMYEVVEEYCSSLKEIIHNECIPITLPGILIEVEKRKPQSLSMYTQV